MRHLALVSLLLLSAPTRAGIEEGDLIFRRGDANADGNVTIADASHIAAWLYSGGPEPSCLNQADANHDGAVDGSDPVFLSSWLYNGGPAPPAPGPSASSCSASPSPTISCDTLSCP